MYAFAPHCNSHVSFISQIQDVLNSLIAVIEQLRIHNAFITHRPHVQPLPLFYLKPFLTLSLPCLSQPRLFIHTCFRLFPPVADVLKFNHSFSSNSPCTWGSVPSTLKADSLTVKEPPAPPSPFCCKTKESLLRAYQPKVPTLEFVLVQVVVCNWHVSHFSSLLST